jgi:type VI protein secretion system component VasK
MTTVWIAIACLVVAVAAWRFRRANRILRRILDEERAETDRHADQPAELDEFDEQQQEEERRHRRSSR